MNRAFVSSQRLNIIGIVILFAFLALLCRLFYLHVWNQEKLTSTIDRNRQNFQVVAARRGNIVDCRGNLLATTASSLTLGVDPQVVRPEDLGKFEALGVLLGRDPEELKALAQEKYKRPKNAEAAELHLVRWKKIAEGISDDVYEKIMKLGIKGVYGNRKHDRTYPSGSLAAHVLGFVNKEEQPVGGVEQFLDFYLRGQDGWRESEKDGKRRELVQFTAREVEPVNGDHVQLSLDLVVQHAIEQEIKRIVDEMDPVSATIIVSEPSTGYLLGLANYPTYDPNEFWKYDIDFHRNRAVSDVFEPGSPFKAVTIGAGFNESIINLEDVYDCSIDRLTYQGRIVRLPKDHRPFNQLTVRDIMRKSSNRGLAQIAMKLGDHKLYNYSRAFGFGEKTGYGPDGEVIGTVHPVKDWDGLTISRMPMGHAISCTPLQLHCAIGAIANGGVLMRPHIVKSVFDEAGNPVLVNPPEAKRRVFSEQTARLMAALLEEVVGPEGTCKRAAINGFNVAGKSGTSQKIIKGRYSTQEHVASFSGFFPSHNPRVHITIVIDGAKIGSVAYGGVVAAPAFRNVGERLIQHLCIKPNDAVRGWLACDKNQFWRN